MFEAAGPFCRAAGNLKTQTAGNAKAIDGTRKAWDNKNDWREHEERKHFF